MKTSLAMLIVVVSIVLTSSPFAVAGREQVAGQLAGASFAPDNMTLTKNMGLDTVKVSGKTVDTAQGYALTFAVGKDFIPDNELTLRFNMNKGETPFGRTIECKAFSFGTAAYRAQHYKSTGEGSVGRGVTGVFVTCAKPKGVSGNLTAMDNIAATVTFNKKIGNAVSGHIQLRLPDEMKTRITGTFTAKLEGF